MHSNDAADPAGRRTVVACLVIAFVAVATWWPRLGGPIDLRWDGGAYFILGTALAQGEGYRLLSEPGSLPSSLHPPLLPALVAAHQLVLGSADPLIVGRVLRISTVLASIAYALAVFVLLRRHLPRGYAFVAAVLAVLQPQYAYFSDALYAETLFALFTLLFFILQRWRESTACFLLSGLCAVLAYEARTAGIALLAAWVADLLLRRDFKRAAVALAIAAAPVLAWTGWIKAVEASPEYQRPSYAYQTAPYMYFNVSYARNLTLRDPWAPERGPLTKRSFLLRVWENAQVLPESIGKAVSSWEQPLWFSLPLAALVFAGLALLARHRQWLMLLYVALSVAAVCSTPFAKQFVRYLLPLYPFFILALFMLLARIEAEPRPRWLPLPAKARKALAWLVVGGIGAQMLLVLADVYERHYDDVAYEDRGRDVRYRLFYYAPDGSAFDAAIDWLKPRMQPADVVAAGDPQWVWLRTGHKAVLPPFALDGRKGQQLVDTVPVKYLLAPASGPYNRYTSALLRENPTAWSRIWSSGDGSIEIWERVPVR